MEKKTHWKKLTNPDYIGAYAIEPGKDLVVKILQVQKEQIKTERGKEEKLVARLEAQKPMIVNATNAKAITKALGSPMIEDWAGKYVSLYEVKIDAFGQKNVEALRVRPYPPKMEKKSLTQDRFENMLNQIKEGNYTVNDAKSTFALTKEQLTQLDNA